MKLNSKHSLFEDEREAETVLGVDKGDKQL